MSIIGFNFTKITVEKKGATQGKINVSSNVGIKDIQNAQINLTGTESAGLRFIFKYLSKYEPDIGSIDLEGEVIFMAESKVVQDVLKNWGDSKTVPKEIMHAVLNTALNKCTVEAMVLSRDLNLPSPIPIPKVKVTTKEAEEKKA